MLELTNSRQLLSPQLHLDETMSKIVSSPVIVKCPKSQWWYEHAWKYEFHMQKVTENKNYKSNAVKSREFVPDLYRL